MQIALDDTLGRCQYCLDHKGYLSLFFNIADDPVNDFWDWVGQDTFDFDLSKVFTKTTSLSSTMIGYGGSNSEPDCSSIQCWYITY
mgnify:CR=1 FL=1